MVTEMRWRRKRQTLSLDELTSIVEINGRTIDNIGSFDGDK